MNPIAEHKLKLVRQYVDTELKAWPEVQGMVVVGSVARGVCRPDSDIDTYVFFHPTVEEAVVPAEFMYVFSTREYHDIFTDETTVAPDGDCIHLDVKRVGMSVLEGQNGLDEGERAQLANGIVVWDREGRLTPRLAVYVTYSEDLQRERLLEHLSWSDYLLAERQILKWIDRCGQLAAHDQLITAAEHLIQTLFAYNRQWKPHRTLWLEELSRLEWQPEGLRSTLEEALVIRALTQEDLHRRLVKLQDLFGAITVRLVQDGFLPAEDPSFWIFRETHCQLGYSYNMPEWREAHADHE